MTTRYELTMPGLNELHSWLLEYSVAPRQLTLAMVWEWARDAIASLEAGEGARVEIDARDSITGKTVVKVLSDSAWTAHVAED